MAVANVYDPDQISARIEAILRPNSWSTIGL
jgi:hypothetical protein